MLDLQALVGTDSVLEDHQQQSCFLARLPPQACQRLLCQVPALQPGHELCAAEHHAQRKQL